MRGPEIVLRAARATDADALTSLLMRTYHTTWAPMLRAEVAATFASGERTRAYVQAQCPAFTVAVPCDEAARVVGMVHVIGDFIDALHVAPDRQRQGIGARLLAHAEAGMRANGHALARLETDTFNTQSRAFYARHGYAEVAMYPDEAWDSGFTTVLLTKPLVA
ncbi:GNAT family N-acetyltransferase [Pandoraea nosoerga]|uniref:GNAT family acetyltransferase n=1 Tax=Pandoraea nosoerga TaxID=2508296 RepID=A0A5E4S406_9BURK|nr:GNAT family N-acetyltransferase [Pandoraea nosoerga]MBN4667691.1 GNAT family N-acetyltransferase [Pandoraea nosoerga]MBN4676643.1 GNAT family N-acetyltransferase [Pandoraea nosoerga]MBN4683091.1 GNAT family N-acetyltransferase [Pandoraea nosoerga]MBN4743426.1 GNAT family N-acetyltransferase [Pandoraea nosoerga]VVD68848.1 GNAT family acetyltransferase [Pandoraea nosoerga]